MQTYEGCFSISDIDGNLLFFSDGITIWNKNLQVMTNGANLTGHPSSAQSGIIFPYPYSSTKYIAVTLSFNNVNNLSYSIVDMSQSGGLGAVDTNFKNKLFTGQSGALGESVAATRHSNNYDYWVMAPGRVTTTSYLNVWKVTSAGVQTARHSVATVGRATTPVSAGGYIKFSQDGKAFAWIDFSNNFFCYGNFNNTTGIISNLKVRTISTGAGGSGYGYGVDFTSDGKYLYLTYAPGSTNVSNFTTLEVYNFQSLLAASNPNTIAPVKRLVNPQSLTNGVNDHFGAIQTGPDGRIYITKFGSRSMFVITNPNDPVNLKMYRLDNILTGTAYWGLPNFAAPWFSMTIEPPTIAGSNCAEVSATYKLLVQDGFGFDKVSRITFDFGDGRPGSVITYSPAQAGTKSQTYTYKVPGTYTIKATAYNTDGSVNVQETTQVKVNSCVLRVNSHIRGVHK